MRAFFEKYKHDIAALAFLAAVIVAVFWKPIFLGHVLLPADWLYFEDQMYKELKPADLEDSRIPWEWRRHRDTLVQMYPWESLKLEMYKSGQIPLWNPYSFAGLPLAGNYQSACFNPINLALGLVFGLESLPLLSSMLYLWLASIGTYFLAREMNCSRLASTLAGVTFPLSAYHIQWMWSPVMLTSCLVPLLLLTSRKALLKQSLSWTATSALVFGLVYLTGHLETAAYASCVLVAWLAFNAYLAGKANLKKSTTISVAVIALGILIAGVQIGTFWEPYMQSSVRRESRSYFQMSSLSDALRFGTLGHLGVYFDQELKKRILSEHLDDVLPEYTSTAMTYLSPLLCLKLHGGAVFTNYVGVLALMLAILAVLTRAWHEKSFWCWLAVSAFGIAYFLPVFSLFSVLPVINMMFPYRVNIFFALSLAVLAARGMDLLVQVDSGKNLMLSAATVLGLILLAEAAVGYIHKNHVFESYVQAVIVGLATWLGLSCISFRRGQFLTKGIILLLSTFDLLSVDTWLLQSTTPNFINAPSALTQIIKEEGEERSAYRVCADGTLAPNMNLVYRLQSIQGYEIVVPEKLESWMIRLLWPPDPIEEGSRLEVFYYTWKCDHVFYDMANVKYVLVAKQMPVEVHEKSRVLREKNPLEKFVNPKDLGLTEPHWSLWHDSSVWVFKNNQVWPRAWTARAYKVVEGRKRMWDLLWKEQFSKDVVLLEEKPQPYDSTLASAEDMVRIASYEPNRVEISADMASDGFVVLSDTYFPGWYCTIDGKDSKIYAAYGLFRAVQVPKGKHTVVFKYNPLSFRIGAAISGVALLAVLGMLGYGLRRKK